jgi:predicted DNA-binding transcriptional regulator YafY
MKADRLLSILLLLQVHGQLSASELAGRLEVSVRTVMRDVEALSAAGVPVYANRGRHGGIALLAGYRTDVSGLTADETRALFVLTSERAHGDLGLGQAIGSALRKIMAALPAAQRPDAHLASRRILIDPVRWRGPASAPDDLGALQQAVFEDKRLRLRYRHGRDAQARTYTVDPYGLVSKAGVWYLVADRRGQPELFRADRVLSATVLDQDAQRRDGVELAALWDDLRRRIDDLPAPVAVRIRIRRDRLAQFLRVHQADLAENFAEADSGDGPHASVALNFRSLGAAEQMLAFGPDLEVLAPAELRQVFARMAADTAGLYSGSESA